MTLEDIIVAVIDSEVDINHPDLKGRVVHKRNYTNEEWGNPDVHGTTVRYRQPKAGELVTEALTYPYHMIQIPKLDVSKVIFKHI